MSSFLESLKSYYGTSNLYGVLKLEKEASITEVKKAYRKLSLEVHPDRVAEEEKENATEKFKLLGKVYSILSDEDKKVTYDKVGIIDDLGDGWEDRDWTEYWRTLFKEITVEDIVNYEKKYKNSEEELQDLIEAYKNGKGKISYILNYVPFACPDDEERIKGILQDLITKGEIPEFKAFIEDTPKKQAARKRKWLKEAEEAEKIEQEYLAKKNSNKHGSRKEDLEKGDLVKAIMKRNLDRETSADLLFQHLEAKYCKPAKGKKSKK